MSSDQPKSFLYTVGEECMNAISHGVAALLSVVAVIVLIVSAATRGDAIHVVTFSIYGFTLFLMYLSSTLYHSLSRTRANGFFQKLDHISIYLLIAGTYTPFALCTVKGSSGWQLFYLVWGMALAGVIFKSVFGVQYDRISTLLYVLMGWSVLLVVSTLVENLHAGGLFLLALGGVFYTAGVYYYIKGDSVKWYHGVWHFFVTAGSTCHYFTILFYIIP